MTNIVITMSVTNLITFITSTLIINFIFTFVFYSVSMIITVAMAISMTLMTLVALMNVSMATTSIVLVNALVVIASPTRSVPATSHIVIRIIGHSIRTL